MTLPSISVVIPCFNGEKYIATAIRSVLDQDAPDLQIIVVDDGSTDRSTEVVAREFPQVRLLRQPNQGVAAARNLGIQNATGSWIAFLDADDVWLPGKLRAQWQSLCADPSARMAYTAWQVWTSSEPAPTTDYLADVHKRFHQTALWAGPSGWIYPHLLLDCEVWTSTVLVQRSLLAEIGGFDTGLRIGEDYDLWLRASRVTPILRVAAPYALYRMHPDSITKAAPGTNYRGEVVARALAQWGYLSPDGTSAQPGDVNRALAKSWSDFAGAHLAAGNYALARRGGWMSMKADWRHASGWKVLAKTIVRAVSAP